MIDHDQAAAEITSASLIEENAAVAAPTDLNESERLSRSTRFRSGRSGNPRGRPKTPVSGHTVREAAFLEPVVVTINGKKRKLPYIQVLIMNLKVRAANGNMKAIKLLVKYCPPRVLDSLPAKRTRTKKTVVDQPQSLGLSESTRMELAKAYQEIKEEDAAKMLKPPVGSR